MYPFYNTALVTFSPSLPQTCFMSYGRIPPDTIMGKIAAHYVGGEASVCGCCARANAYVYANLRTNQIYDIAQCKYGGKAAGSVECMHDAL